jgi:hypothetical protein
VPISRRAEKRFSIRKFLQRLDAGANFYFDTGEPLTPAGHADDAYVVARRQRSGH